MDVALIVSSLSWNAPLVNLNRPAMRASTPVMETFEEYKARVLEKPADGPPTIAGVAAARGSVKATKVSSPGTSSRPTRADSRPQLREMLHESSDLLSHQAIMENFVRRLIQDSPRAPRAPAPKHRLSRRLLCPQVHHNPWEALQHMKRGDALNRVDKRLAYMSPAERMSTRAWQQRGLNHPPFYSCCGLVGQC